MGYDAVAAKRYRDRQKAKSIGELRVVYDAAPTETDEQIDARIAERFEILDTLVDMCIAGDARSLIVSGPAGLGKSFNVEKKLKQWDPSEVNSTSVSGYVRATGLVKLLYEYRNEGQVLVFDDADSIFYDDVSLNLLKKVCDTTERRRVSWMSEGVLVTDESGERVPRQFDFEGTVIFITNVDFDELIDRGHKLAPHLTALVSRSHYVDLSMKTPRDYLVRIRQVIKSGLLNHLESGPRGEVIEYIEANYRSLRELSLRIALKIAALRKSNPRNWRSVAKVTCSKSHQ